MHARVALLSPGWRARQSRHVAARAGQSQLCSQLATSTSALLSRVFAVRVLSPQIFRLPLETAMSTPPPFSEEQLAWLRSKFTPTTPLTDPPTEDPSPGNGSSDNRKLNSHRSIVIIHIKLKAYPNPTLCCYTPPSPSASGTTRLH